MTKNAFLEVLFSIGYDGAPVKRLLFLILAAPVFASASATRDLETWLDRKVTFEACTQGPLDTEEKVRSYVTEVLKAGVAKLENVNPEFIEERMARFKKRPTRISCAESPEGSEADTRRPFLFQPARLRLGRALQKSSYSSFSKLVIFHEFLHVIAFDNLKPNLHNDGKKLELRDSENYLVRERDNVYACSSVAYREGLWAFDLEATHVFETCSKARIIDGKVAQHTVGALHKAEPTEIFDPR